MERGTEVPVKGAGRLKVGLLLPEDGCVAWVEHLVREIAAASFAEVALIGVAGRADARPRPRTSLLWRLYSGLDRAGARSRPDAFARADLAAAVPVEIRRFDPRGPLPSCAGLDVLLLLGELAGLRGRLTPPRFGLWWFAGGDGAGAAEVISETAATATTLWAALPDGRERPLCRSWSRTNDKSVRRNRQRRFWKAAHLPARKLRELHLLGAAALAGAGGSAPGPGEPARSRDHAAAQRRQSGPGAQAPAGPARNSDGEDVSAPGNLETAAFALRLARRALCGAVETTLYRPQWCLAYERDPEPARVRPERLRRLIPPGDRFWADPFPVEAGGRCFVFVEEWLYRRGKGRISVLELEGDTVMEAGTALEESHHLSHPFLFRWNGRLYMIPESGGARRVELYRCLSFPLRWERDRVLLDGLSGVDATLEEIDGAWWMFLNVGKRGISNHDELHLYYADSPLGPWREHARNPVKSDARSARPAGRLIRDDGQLLRPAQDCTPRYGSAVCLQRILELTPDRFAEEPVARLGAEAVPGADRIHTLNGCGGVRFIDFQRRLPRIAWGRPHG